MCFVGSFMSFISCCLQRPPLVPRVMSASVCFEPVPSVFLPCQNTTMAMRVGTGSMMIGSLVLALQFTKDALQGQPVKIKLLSMDQVRERGYSFVRAG